MNELGPQDIRTFALIGHQGSGKTSLAEAMLLLSGQTDNLPRTEGDESLLDFQEEERDRGGSIAASLATFAYGGQRLHVIDTPGDGSFIHEARSVLRGVDAVISVISAPDGVEVGTERTWRLADKLDLPRLIFVNKMDRERADPDRVLAQIEEVLGVTPIPLELPIGKEEGFRGVVDLIRGEARLFKHDRSGEVTDAEVPEAMQGDLGPAVEMVTEAAAESNDELLEKYLETLELSQQEVVRGLHDGIRAGTVVPVIFGVASENKGVHRLLDVMSVLPAPTEHPPQLDVNGEEILPDPDAPFVGQVIKSLIDPYAGTVNIVRVFRGSLTTDAQAVNTTRGHREKLGNLHWLVGKQMRTAMRATVGDLVAVNKLDDTHTGDTLAASGHEVVLPELDFPASMATLIVKPASRRDEDRLRDGLLRISEEDPAFIIGSDSLTKETTVSGQSRAHIEACLKKMARKYDVNVTTEVPPVPYRETIKGRTEVEGKHKKQSGGRGQYGVAYLRIEPLPRGEGFEFVDAIKGGAIPRQYIPAVEKGIVQAMENGVLAGFPVQDIRVTAYDGKYHPVDSSEAAFMLAGSKGFKAGFMQCNPTLLEPIVKLTIVCPEESVGDVMGDIGSRRGRLQNTDYRGSRAIVHAYAPQAEVQTYAADLRSMTQGQGTFTMEHAGYEEVPGQIRGKLIEEVSRKPGNSD